MTLQVVEPDAPLDREFEYLDMGQAVPGDYYYVRVTQLDGGQALVEPVLGRRPGTRPERRRRPPMKTIRFDDIDALRAEISEEFGSWSDPLEVKQATIDAFAELSGDRNWIHVDVERSRRESPSVNRSPTACSP